MLGGRWRKPPFIKRPWLRWGLIAGFVIYLIAGLWLTIEVNWGRVYEGLDRGWQFVLVLHDPDFLSAGGDIWEG
jgi:phosphonate transport system permease protein